MKAVNVDVASMHPSSEIAITIETVIKSVCEKCKFYDKSFGVCRGEVLPVERAILNNAKGRGLCDIVKDDRKRGVIFMKETNTNTNNENVAKLIVTKNKFGQYMIKCNKCEYTEILY